MPKNVLASSTRFDEACRYRASFLLTTPEMLIGTEAWTIGGEEGDSHIILGSENGVSYEGYSVNPNTNYSVHFYFLGNHAGRLGRITSDDFGAENIEEAMVWASDAISSVLSALSISHDAPLYIGQIDLFDLQSRFYRSRRIVPFGTRYLAFHSVPSTSVESRFFANLYREALISTSEAYRFLCLYKMLDGLLAYRSVEARKQRKKWLHPIVYSEKIPEKHDEQLAFIANLYLPGPSPSAMMLNIFPTQAQGWKFRRLLNELRGTRDKIAHSLLDGGVLGLSTDNLNISRYVSV